MEDLYNFKNTSLRKNLVLVLFMGLVAVAKHPYLINMEKKLK